MIRPSRLISSWKSHEDGCTPIFIQRNINPVITSCSDYLNREWWGRACVRVVLHTTFSLYMPLLFILMCARSQRWLLNSIRILLSKRNQNQNCKTKTKIAKSKRNQNGNCIVVYNSHYSTLCCFSRLYGWPVPMSQQRLHWQALCLWWGERLCWQRRWKLLRLSIISFNAFLW